MTFEAYARDWLERQNFIKNIRKTTRQSIDYICRAIGPIEIPDVTESDVDRIFTDVQLGYGFRNNDYFFTLIKYLSLPKTRKQFHTYC